MGVVYQAWQPQLARRVAIKVVQASAGIGSEDRRRWLREARAIGRVRHPNIVRLHEAGEQDGCLYLILDLITGGSLADRVTGPLPARVAVELMAAVARAVDQIHRAGMLHLDIKPSNVLLDGRPDATWDQVTPILADFGIARAGDDPGVSTTGPIGVAGTPSYMAPEQIVGDRAGIGPRADVFALGATLYFLLTGRPPFQAASVIETLDLVRTREPASPRTLVPGLPRDLETIALTCLRKDPRRRYASAGALADDLERWLEGFPIRARPVSKLEQLGRWCRRRPALASLVALLAVTVASSLVGLLTLWRHSEAERARAETALARAVASDKATSGAVRDLVDLLTTTVHAPQMLVSERLEDASRAVRDLTAKLCQERQVATANLVAICELERELAEAFRPRGRYSAARRLLMDSLDLLEGRSRADNDPEVDAAYARTLLELAWGDLVQGHLDAAVGWVERAGEGMESWAQDPRCLKTVVLLHSARQSIAAQLRRGGLEEQRRKLLEAHIRMLEHASDSNGGAPAIRLLAALTRANLAADGSAIATLRAALRSFPANQRLPQPLETAVGSWIASDVNPYPSGRNNSGQPMDRLDPEAHANFAIRAIESRCDALGVDRSSLPAVAYAVAVVAAERGSEQRQAGLLDDARRTAARFSAFANRLLKRDPDDAVFHLLLAMSFAQESKNAWQLEDHAAIKRALQKALGEARTALRLDPRNRSARSTLAGLQEKLVGLPSEPPSSP
jgi:hypothetical protein